MNRLLRRVLITWLAATGAAAVVSSATYAGLLWLSRQLDDTPQDLPDDVIAWMEAQFDNTTR